MVIAVLAGPPSGKHAGHAVELLDGQPGIIRDGHQARGGGAGAGLDERVIGKGAAVFDGLWVGFDLRKQAQFHALDARLGQDTIELGQLLRIAGGDEDYHPSAAFCAAMSSLQPFWATSSIPLSCSRPKRPCSPVPWISTKSPDSCITTLRSTSARESSS